MCEWVKCSERLPDEGELVLIDTDTGYDVARLKLMDDGSREFVHEGEYYYSLDAVDYWAIIEPTPDMLDGPAFGR